MQPSSLAQYLSEPAPGRTAETAGHATICRSAACFNHPDITKRRAIVERGNSNLNAGARSTKRPRGLRATPFV
eukprot:11104640-Alexandrium_andersonii.AAC.1